MSSVFIDLLVVRLAGLNQHIFLIISKLFSTLSPAQHHLHLYFYLINGIVTHSPMWLWFWSSSLLLSLVSYFIIIMFALQLLLAFILIYPSNYTLSLKLFYRVFSMFAVPGRRLRTPYTAAM